MAKKAKREESLHDLSAQELEARLREVQENHFRLRFRHAGNPLKNPMQIRQARREVARLETILREKAKETV
jgi:large subunit ribosomal protein L29